MDHNPEGAPVLISIEDIGPLFGRAFVDEIGDFEVYELAERTSWVRSWRVEVPRIPHRLVQPLRAKLNTLSTPVEVRIWGAVGPDHYSGRAYGGFNGYAPGGGGEPYMGLTLHGQGAIRAGNWP